MTGDTTCPTSQGVASLVSLSLLHIATSAQEEGAPRLQKLTEFNDEIKLLHLQYEMPAY
jgi:hypothetical protein